MSYIFSISVIVLVIGLWQESKGSGHSEAHLGSDRFDTLPPTGHCRHF